MDGSSYFPSRPEMEASLAAFAEQAGIAVRYDCRWERTRRDDGPDGTTFMLETTDGEYRTPGPRAGGRRRASRGARRRRASSTPRHYARHARRVDVRGQAAVHHRQAELGLRARLRASRPGRRRSRSASPSPAKTSVADEVAGRRPGALRAAVRGQLPRASGSRSSTPRSTRSSHVGDGLPGRASSGPTTGRR